MDAGMWLAGGSFEAPASTVRTSGVWHPTGARVRVVAEGEVSALVAGVCRASDGEIGRVARMVAQGRTAAIVTLDGSYWMAVTDLARARTVVAGDLAETRAVYATHTGRGPAWATDVAMLAAQLGCGPDLELLAAQVAVGSAGHWPRRSVWEGIERVPGGHALVLERGTCRTVDVRPRPDSRTMKDGAEEVGSALRGAAQAYAREAGERVSADLSGGLDSSSVVVAAAEVTQVVAVTYGGPLADRVDTDLAERVAQYTGVEHHVSPGGAATAHFLRWPDSLPPAPSMPVSSYALDADYLTPARNVSPLHLTGHGGDVVLESSPAAWTSLVQAGQRRRARAAVTALARRVNQAPGPLWKAVQEAAHGRPRAMARAAEALADNRMLGDGLSAWSWCPVGAASAWLTPLGRETVSRMLDESGSTVGEVDAGEWDDWSALTHNGSVLRDSAPVYVEHGVVQVSPFLDNEVVRACLSIGAGERRQPDVYKPLLALALPYLPAWLVGRNSKGHFGPLLYEGLRTRQQQLHELIDASGLVAAGLVDPAPVHATLTGVVSGTGRHPLPALETFLTTSWWLSRVAAPVTAAGAR
ncbi:asparagine synthase-related protein [Streptomyces sp. NPDC094468]|uniref:asparagine synthase-related protein n=1 Tax=Streptomyces sp. NPDC094468 TaxID=3366066 RepID=UPI00382FBDFB